MSINTAVFEGGGGIIPTPEPLSHTEFTGKCMPTIESFIVAYGQKAVSIRVEIINNNGTQSCAVLKGE